MITFRPMLKIYRVGTEVHNSRCPTLKCPYSGASWVVVYMDELWRDIVKFRHLENNHNDFASLFHIEQNVQSHSNSHNVFILFIYDFFSSFCLFLYNSTSKIENIQNTL